MMRSSFLFKLLGVVGAAWAIPHSGPAPTQVGAYDPDMAIKGVSPRPTSGLELRSPAELFKRQEDRTCGFINADYQNAATCSSGYYCAYNTLNTVFGCCSGALSDCYIETACYPSKAAVSSCNSACLANPYNYICTEGSATLCHVYVSINGASSLYNFGCDTEDYTSYVYGTFTTGASQGISSIPSIKPLIISTTPSSIPSSRTTEPLIGPSSTPSTSPSSSPSPTPASSGSKTPVGAIVGGVVGGIAVLGIAVVAVIFLLRRRRTPDQPPVVAPVMPPIQQHYDPKPYVQPYTQQPGAPVGVMVPQQQMSPPPPLSPAMSPPLSPAPPYGEAGQYHNTTVMPKGVHEVE